jgi:hypothetical protein
VVECKSTHFRHPGFVGALTCTGCPWADLPNDAAHVPRLVTRPLERSTERMAEPADPTARDPYPAIDLCRHLGPSIERGTCNVCGLKGQPFDIHACAVHGRCTVRRYRTDRPDLKVCVRCGDYTPPSN